VFTCWRRVQYCADLCHIVPTPSNSTLSTQYCADLCLIVPTPSNSTLSTQYCTFIHSNLYPTFYRCWSAFHLLCIIKFVTWVYDSFIFCFTRYRFNFHFLLLSFLFTSVKLTVLATCRVTLHFISAASQEMLWRNEQYCSHTGKGQTHRRRQIFWKGDSYQFPYVVTFKSFNNKFTNFFKKLKRFCIQDWIINCGQYFQLLFCSKIPRVTDAQFNPHPSSVNSFLV
jgi:hypothetical protein